MDAILIPAFNESLNIGRIVKECLSMAELVLVVDDGSRDFTADIAFSAGAQVIKNKENKGLGTALHMGIDFLFAKSFTTIVTIDGDGAHNPALIPEIVHYHKSQGADLTIGSRLLNSERINDFPSPKRSANKLGAIFLKKFCSINLSDVASGMRVIGQRFNTLPKLASGYGFTFDLLCVASENNFKLVDFPIDVRYDSRQFFATRIPEIIGLLNAASAFTKDDSAKEKITFLKMKINNCELFRIKIDNLLFYLFPIKEYDAYMVQEQHPIFAKNEDHVETISL